MRSGAPLAMRHQVPSIVTTKPQRSQTVGRHYATSLSVIAAVANPLQSGAPAAFDVEAFRCAPLPVTGAPLPGTDYSKYLLNEMVRLESDYRSGRISPRKYWRYKAELSVAMANAQQAPPPNSGMDMNTMAMMAMLSNNKDKDKNKDEKQKGLMMMMLMGGLNGNGGNQGTNNNMPLWSLLM